MVREMTSTPTAMQKRPNNKTMSYYVLLNDEKKVVCVVKRTRHNIDMHKRMIEAIENHLDQEVKPIGTAFFEYSGWVSFEVENQIYVYNFERTEMY